MNKRFVYWLWGIAEKADLSDSSPRKFWRWLLYECDKHFGYVKRRKKQ